MSVWRHCRWFYLVDTQLTHCGMNKVTQSSKTAAFYPNAFLGIKCLTPHLTWREPITWITNAPVQWMWNHSRGSVVCVLSYELLDFDSNKIVRYCQNYHTRHIYRQMSTSWCFRIKRATFDIYNIFHIFQYLYDFDFMYMWILKVWRLEKMKKSISIRRGRVFDNGNGDWYKLDSAFFCQMIICVEACIFASNHAFFVSIWASVCVVGVS